MKMGLFIVIEGPDGSGKTSQVNRLHNYIKFLSKYNDVLTTHEPWKNDELKRILKTEKDAYSSAEKLLDLFVGKDRKSHLCHLINPVLEEGVITISDRYLLSTYTYQQIQGVDFETIRKKHQMEGIIVPDITFLLDIDLETALERIKKRGLVAEKFEKEGFLKKTIEKYREVAVMSKEKEMEKILGRIEIIDGRKTEEEVFGQIKEIFNPVYEEWKNN